MEKQAVDAERASTKYMQVKYLSKKIGEKFSGLISGITDWGIYVELEENKCEGMITLSSMKDDQYFFDNELQMIVGYHQNYKIGQEVEVVKKRLIQTSNRLQTNFLVFMKESVCLPLLLYRAAIKFSH